MNLPVRAWSVSLMLALAAAPSAQAAAVEPAAHRSRLTPDGVENDLGEARRTAAAGPYWLETDLRTTRDGEVFLLHDDTLDRTTDGEGPIASAEAATVASLHVRDGAVRLTSRHPTRALALFDWAAATPGVRLLLDAKAVDPAWTARELDSRGLISRAIYLTFDAAAARAALAANPDLRVSLLASTRAAIKSARALGAGARLALYLSQDADPALVRQAHAAGFTVISDAIPGFTKGEPLDVRAEREGAGAYRAYLAGRPVDILVTNHPAALAAAHP